MTTTLPTLAELTAGYRTRTNNPTAASPYSIGRAGSTYAGQTGAKSHVLIAYWQGRTEAACGARNDGRSRVTVVPDADTDAVTCAKCRAWLERTRGL